MAVSVAAWVNTDSPGLRRMIASLSPGLVSGLPPSPSIPAPSVGVWFPLVRVHRPVRVLLQAAHASRLPNQMETDTLALIYAAFLENMGR